MTSSALHREIWFNAYVHTAFENRNSHYQISEATLDHDVNLMLTEDLEWSEEKELKGTCTHY